MQAVEENFENSRNHLKQRLRSRVTCSRMMYNGESAKKLSMCEKLAHHALSTLEQRSDAFERQLHGTPFSEPEAVPKTAAGAAKKEGKPIPTAAEIIHRARKTDVSALKESLKHVQAQLEEARDKFESFKLQAAEHTTSAFTYLFPTPEMRAKDPTLRTPKISAEMQEGIRRQLIIVMRCDYHCLEDRVMNLEETVAELEEAITTIENTARLNLQKSTYREYHRSVISELQRKIKNKEVNNTLMRLKKDNIQKEFDKASNSIALAADLFRTIGSPMPEELSSLPKNHPAFTVPPDVADAVELPETITKVTKEPGASSSSPTPCATNAAAEGVTQKISIQTHIKDATPQRVVMIKTPVPAPPTPPTELRMPPGVSLRYPQKQQPVRWKRTYVYLTPPPKPVVKIYNTPIFEPKQPATAPSLAAAAAAVAAEPELQLSELVEHAPPSPIEPELTGEELARSFFNPKGDTATEVEPCWKREVKMKVYHHPHQHPTAAEEEEEEEAEDEIEIIDDSARRTVRFMTLSSVKGSLKRRCTNLDYDSKLQYCLRTTFTALRSECAQLYAVPFEEVFEGRVKLF